jgi:type IV secretory pathway TrbD component
VALAIEQAVALHAPRWGEADLIDNLAGGQPVPDRDMIAMLLQAGYQAALPGFLERFAHRLDPEVVGVIEAFAGPIGRFVYGTGTPETIVHLDFRADNFLFGQHADAPPLVVVDWQTFSVGLGMADVAYAISGSFPDPAQRAAVERDLLAEYRSRLAAEGIELSADDCWRDYRFTSLWGLIITVIATLQAAQTERGDDMFAAMAARHGRHAHDLDALDLLR